MSLVKIVDKIEKQSSSGGLELQLKKKATHKFESQIQGAICLWALQKQWLLDD